MTAEKPQIQIETEIGTDEEVQEPANVILFNDEVHSFDEVIFQLVKALKCEIARAESLTWEVHNNGQAVVYRGPVPRCIEVSGVLEEIDLRTRIEM